MADATPVNSGEAPKAVSPDVQAELKAQAKASSKKTPEAPKAEGVKLNSHDAVRKDN